MDSLANLLNDPEKLINTVAMFALWSSVFFVLKLLIITLVAVYCFKKEKDITKRNIWVAIILIGKLYGAAAYIVLEKMLKNKKEGGENGLSHTVSN